MKNSSNEFFFENLYPLQFVLPSLVCVIDWIQISKLHCPFWILPSPIMLINTLINSIQ